jgi:uncharacterized repeat protein (TIGR01451 family)
MFTLSGASVQLAGAAGTADMQVAIKATPVLPGTAFANTDTTQNAVAYTVAVTNGGQSAAQDVLLTDLLPAAMTNPTYCELSDGVCSATPVTFLGSVAIGNMSKTTRTFRIFAHVSAAERNGRKVISNTASVSASTTDTHLNNNSASVGVSVDTVPTETFTAAFAGNHNVVVAWTADGGQPVITYDILACTVATVPCPSDNIAFRNTALPGDTTQLDIPATDGTTYTVQITGTNAVGTGDIASTGPLLPDVHRSAHIFTNTGCTDPTSCTQTTGDQEFPDTVLTQIEQQTVPNGSSVIGALSEASDSAQTFCGGLPCIGQLAVNQLTHTVDGRYLMTVLYDKTIAGGTGTSFTVWFAPSGSTTSSPIAKCPMKGPFPATTACVTKIIRIPASNPDLKVQISVPGSIFDPAWGSR